MYFSVNELVGVAGLPGTAQGVRAALKKLTGTSPELVRKRQGSKAFEYNIECLPAMAQEALKDLHFKKLMDETPAKSPAVKAKVEASKRKELEVMRQCPALLDREVAALTQKQKQIADARATLAQEVLRMREAGLSRAAAVEMIAEASRNGSLPLRIQSAADVANARRGVQRTGVSARRLQGWLSVYMSTQSGSERLALLAPGHTKEKRPEDIGWFYTLFMPHYRNQNGPNLREAYRSFSDEWREIYHDQPAMMETLPSYYAVQRLANKLSLKERVIGRVTGSAARAYDVYQKRDWEQMPVNGIWISDGKSLNMKVAHPFHGRPFTPELTLVIDGRTRYIVGWSLSLSENAIAVADAYRHAMKHHGKPLFVYSDNGGGEKNRMLDADITGIFPRLGIQHMTGIPGNPQARGIIERLNGVLPRRLAMRFQTYNGLSVDPNVARLNGQHLNSLSNALRDNRELTAQNKKTMQKLPTWRQLVDAVEEEIEKYNTGHEHSELPKVNGKHISPAVYRKAMLEKEGDNIEYLSEGELREMFMPQEIRVAQRGWIELENNQYFHKDLINVDGDKVRVAFDIHDPSEVVIRKMDGTFVCIAVWNGNKASPVPVAKVQKAQEERVKRMIALKQKGIRDAEDELRPAIAAQPETDFSRFMPAAPSQDKEQVYIFNADLDDDLKSGTHR
jgi:putative transposase